MHFTKVQTRREQCMHVSYKHISNASADALRRATIAVHPIAFVSCASGASSPATIAERVIIR